jgi:hypothetical protein
MTLASRLAWLLALLALAGGPAAAQVAESPPADGQPDARLWKEPCVLDGKGNGELLRVSGSSAGANMSQGLETYRVQLGTDLLVELTQEGQPMIGSGAAIAEGDRWVVTCARGAIRVLAGEAELRLSVAGKAASVDAKWLQGLAPDRARSLGLARLEGTAALIDALADEPVVGGAEEASARVGLLIAERAIDAGETDRAESALQQAEAGRFPALAGWARRVGERLEAARGAAPLRAVNAVRLGTVRRLVTVPVGKVGEGELVGDPDVFWSRGFLCLRQEGEQAATMRCYDTAVGKWRDAEPYASPYAAAPKLRAKYLGNPGGYTTRLTVEEAGGERVLGEFHSPSLLARDARGGIVVHAAGLVSAEKADVTVHGYDAASGAGSVLAGGGRYFFDGPTSLRSIAQAGRSWSVPAPGRDAGVVCVAEPLTSPDEQRAACLAGKPSGPQGESRELWLFDLAEPGK